MTANANASVPAKNTKLGAILALTAGASFGVGGAFSQIVVAQGFSVIQAILMQLFFGAIILCAILALRLALRKVKFDITRKEILQLIAVGMVSAVSNIAYFMAIDLLSVASAVAMQFQSVWIVVAIQCIVEKTRPKKWTVISAIVIIVGIFFGSGLFEEIISGQIKMNPVGFAFAGINAISYATFLYLNVRVAPNRDSLSRAGIQNVGSFVLIAIVFSVIGDFNFSPIDLAPGAIVLALTMCVIPFVCIATAGSVLSGGLMGILTSFELPAAVVAGFLLLGESVTPIVIGGIVVIMIGIALSQKDEMTQGAKS